MGLTNEQKITLYRLLYLGRQFEDKLGELFAAGKLAGWVHLGKGQEGTGAALSLCLEKDDYLVPYHRSRVSLFGKGLSVKSLLAEIMGKKTGCCKGVGGEAHIMDVATGIYGTGGIIASNIPIGVGLAYASKLEGSGRIVACAFGDGASNRGAFHEALNMAALWNLPIVFLCENNQYAEFTAAANHMKITDIAMRASSYGIPGVIVDGYNPAECYEVFREAVDRARKGEGPTLIESKTYRYSGHYEGDPMLYRPKQEVEQWLKRDPVSTYRQTVLDQQVLTEQEITALEADVSQELNEAVEFAIHSESPTAEDVQKFVYA